jgi:predicted membrane-bound dolichyl-phosphate-mannose-protein mannosyltransferase
LSCICIGLAGTTKYTGFIIVFDIFIIFQLTPEMKYKLSKKLLLLFTGFSLSLIVFIICSLYTLIQFDSFINAINYERVHVQKGQMGFDLNPAGFL